MKESDLKRILTTPTTDDAMDQNITDALLNIDSHTDRSNNYRVKNSTKYLANNKLSGYRFSKVAVIILALVLIGTGTALAAGFYVKTYTHEWKNMTKEEYYEETGIDIDEALLNREDIIRKSFGAGNKMITLPRDAEGNVLEINDEGLIVLEDGTIITPRYIPDPDRYEKAKKAGDEAFAELGFANLLPTYIFDNYILGDLGFICSEITQDGTTYKNLMGEYVLDGYITGDFHSEWIWVNFKPLHETAINQQSILIDNNRTEDQYINSTYTTKGGVLCNISEHNLGNITADIVFESDTIGNGHLMIEFVGFRNKMDKVNEILDTLPFNEDSIDVQNID